MPLHLCTYLFLWFPLCYTEPVCCLMETFHLLYVCAGLHHAVEGRQYNFDPVSRHPPQSYPHFAPCQHRKAWFDTQRWYKKNNNKKKKQDSETNWKKFLLLLFWQQALYWSALCILRRPHHMSAHFNIPLSLLQAAQPRYGREWRFGSGRGLGERASVLRPPCGEHVPGQRGQPEPSRSRRFRLSLAWEKTNHQYAHGVPWVTHVLIKLLAVDIEFKREELSHEWFNHNNYGLGSNNCKSYSCENCF